MSDSDSDDGDHPIARHPIKTVDGLITLLESQNKLIKQLEAKVNDVYKERNRVVQLAAILARDSGCEVGLRHQKDDWPVIVIKLPTFKEVSWHLPKDEIINLPDWSIYKQDYTDYSAKEKYHRLDKFVELSTGAAVVLCK